jgi:hypothetical protein
MAAKSLDCKSVADCAFSAKQYPTRQFIRFLFISILLLLCSAACNIRLPEEISEVVFEKSRFAEPMAIYPGPEDGAKALEYARQNKTDRGLISRIVLTNYGNADKKLLSFLTEHGYSTVECVPLTNRFGTETYCYIVHKSAREKLSQAAKRRLLDITYSNEYESSRFGMPATIYAVTFKYKIDVLLKEFPAIYEIYEGEAQAALDPNTGKWKLTELSLSDNGMRHFMDYIHSNYEPHIPDYKRKAIERLRKIITNDRILMGAQEAGRQSYICRIKFISFDPISGSVEAENQWKNVKTGMFDKSYKVTGRVAGDGDLLILSETVMTQSDRPRQMTLNYTLQVDQSGERLSGQWSSGKGRGDIWFSVK